ncbi:MAG: hypothetical protein MUF64_20640 [Polyangiaceae bacterium]|nr:hypothetical protein [Polyangiaceae bacterium]
MTQPPRAGVRGRGGLPRGPGPLLPFDEPPVVGGRALALHFPDLACELAIFDRESRVGVAGALRLDRPLAAVLLGDGQAISDEAPLHSATQSARKSGVRPGQRAGDAKKILPSLEVRGVAQARMVSAMQSFAEIVLGVGAGHRLLPPDTLLIDLTDVTGAGMEGPLLAHACERLGALGHRVRAAVASREALALLLARFGPDPRTVVPPGREHEALSPLPPELLQRTEQSLRQHPPLRIQHGASLREEVCWDEPIRGADPLSFAFHWVAVRAAARLVGRGIEAREATLSLRRASGQEERLEPTLRSPIRKTSDLVQAFRFRMNDWPADEPVAGLTVTLGGLSHAAEGPVSQNASLQALAQELGAELGPGRVGLLSPRDSMDLPYLQEPATPQVGFWSADALTPPTRVLDVPVLVLGKVARGSRVEIDGQTFVVHRVTLVDARGSGPNPGLEHMAVWLTHGDSGALSWMTRDRRLKRTLLHGWFT